MNKPKYNFISDLCEQYDNKRAKSVSSIGEELDAKIENAAKFIYPSLTEFRPAWMRISTFNYTMVEDAIRYVCECAIKYYIENGNEGYCSCGLFSCHVYVECQEVICVEIGFNLGVAFANIER